MKTYKVSVREEIYSSIYVNADDAIEAKDTARSLYSKIDHDLCVDQYMDLNADVEDLEICIQDDEVIRVSPTALNLLKK